MSTAAVRLARCPICEGSRLSRLPTPGHWIGQSVFAGAQEQLGLSRCRQCSFVFVNPRPATELLQSFYQGDDYSCHCVNCSLEASRKAQSQLAFVEAYGPYSPRRFLDFGCGGGYLLRAAVQRGWSAVGYDIGPRAIEACRQQGLEATSDLAALARNPFNAVFLSHVFEHVEDQGALLRLLRSLVVPGGRLFIEVPNARSMRARLSAGWLSRHCGFDERYRAFPIHLSYFSVRTLWSLLEKHGYRVLGAQTFGIGLEELLLREDNPPPRLNAERGQQPPTPRPDSVEQKAKDAFKRYFYGWQLGENVLIVAA